MSTTNGKKQTKQFENSKGDIEAIPPYSKYNPYCKYLYF